MARILRLSVIKTAGMILMAVLCSCAEVVVDSEYPDGPSINYYASGARREEGYYSNGYRVSTWTRWYDNGKKASQGDRAISARFGSSRVGSWKYWHWNGQLAASGSYSDDMFEGAWTFWDDKGNVVSRAIFKDGEGDYAEDYDSGERRCAGPLVRNLRNGHWVFWFKNGRKQAEGECKGGNRNGEWIFWNDDGTEAGRRTFNWLRDSDWNAIAASIAD